MNKLQLHLIYKKLDGKQFTIKVDNPSSEVQQLQIKTAMTEIADTKVFGELVPYKAQMVETSITDYDMTE